MFSTCNISQKKNTWESILLTIKRITQRSQRVITASTYQLEFMFLPFSSNISLRITSHLLFPFWKIILPFKNWGMRRTAGTSEFLRSRFDVPRVYPGVAPLTKKPEDSGYERLQCRQTKKSVSWKRRDLCMRSKEQDRIYDSINFKKQGRISCISSTLEL